MPGSDRYFLELSARVSLKVGTKYIIVLLYDLKCHHYSRIISLILSSEKQQSLCFSCFSFLNVHVMGHP